MALPPRAAAVLVLLSKSGETPTTARDSGSTFNSFVNMGTSPSPQPPQQSSFYASQIWYQDYPPSTVVKVHLGLLGPYGYEPNSAVFGNRIYLNGYTGNQTLDLTYPGDIVYAYDPTPPPTGPGESPPNPNGTVETNTITNTTPAVNNPGYFFRPRWVDDTPYDLTTDGIGEGTIWPKFNTDYLIGIEGFQQLFPDYVYQLGPWSADLTVTNKQSEVLNEQTTTYEYYDFTQTTFDFKQTTKVKLYLDANVCCWNKGTVINGTVTFQSIDVTTEAVGGTPGAPDPTATYGFGGMIATTGSTVADAGDQSFTVTIDSSYTPVEITIPTVAGKITFINDFSVDSVTAPS